MKKFVNMVETNVMSSKAAREQIRMLIKAKVAILKSGDFVPATQVAQLASVSASDLSKWKHDRQIFAIRHDRRKYLPLYTFTPTECRPRKEMEEILKIFGEMKDGWGLAFWFAALNSFLDDERPQDLLTTDPQRVILAARDEMAKLQHG